MTKYRLLTQDELAGLEKEFIDFLVVNGITAEDWGKIKANEPGNTAKIIESFSDVVFEKILRGVKFLEIYETKSVRSFKLDADEITMITMEASNEEADFRNPDYIAKAMSKPPEDLLIYSTQKPYATIRELEIFKMIQSGCFISNGKIHSALEEAL